MQVTFKGTPTETIGRLPNIGQKAPDFSLVKSDLSPISLQDFSGKTCLLNVFISLDTPVCALSVIKFNQEASKIPNCKILCVSMDLPFALSRFCATNGIENLEAASAFRNPDFGKNYGLTIASGPLSSLLARAIIIINAKGEITYTELVPEITQEPNYDAALKALK
jgi:thiol peroxidase